MPYRESDYKTKQGSQNNPEEGWAGGVTEQDGVLELVLCRLPGSAAGTAGHGGHSFSTKKVSL